MQPDAPVITEETRNRAERLRVQLQALGPVCIGYSGGVDSAFLLAAAVDALGSERVIAVTGVSAAVPAVQLETARACARRIGAEHIELDTAELEDERYAANPTNRCYFCKTELWGRLRAFARERGIETLLDGSNADDARDYRPGRVAAKENGVRSPLLEAGLTKREIRLLSRERQLPTWDQPAAPCLSSRLPYGFAVTPERLRQIEAAEALLRTAGLREFRVRHHGDVARIEAAPAEIDRALAAAARLDAGLRALGFGAVLLDVEGYRQGALNEGLSLVPLATVGERTR